MKHILLLLIICTLSGCGLFKKTSKELEKRSEVSEQSSSKQTNIDFQDQSKSLEVNTSISTEASINGYVVKADAIKFNSDGSFDAIGNVSMKGNSEWKKQKQDSTAKQLQSDISLKEKSEESEKQSHEVKDYTKTTKSETDFLGIIAGGIVIVGVVIGLVWWFKNSLL